MTEEPLAADEASAAEADEALDGESQTIPLAPPAPAGGLASCPRAALPAASEIAASHDAAFQALVNEADRYRDERQWHNAEMAYSAALARFPYQPGYWVQQGHMRKEQAHYFEAEISYRTAAALGVAPEGVAEHLRFVMAQQGVSDARYPIRYARAGAISDMAPSEPDVLLFARLLWRVPGLSNEELLPLLRESASLDAVFAAMVADRRFSQTNVQWLTYLHDGDLA